MSTAIKSSSIRSINPFNNEVVKEFDEMDEKQIENIIALADTAFKSWKNSDFTERARLLHNVATIMRQREDELAKLITLEMGRLLKDSIGEIRLSASIFEYYADNGAKFLADRPLETSTGEATLTYEGLGVHLSVQPWNFPFYQVTRAAAPSIMAGNTVILKHASNVPQCGQMMEDIFLEAGAPKGVYNNLFVRGSKIETIVADERIKAVSLTGSEPAGSSIAAAAGKYVKKSTLELGGSDPLVVLDDVDVDAVATTAVFGRMYNAGQVCISPKRIIVLKKIAAQFEAKALSIFPTLKIGNPLDTDTQVGPLSTEKAAEEIQAQIEKAVAEGATLVYGGKRVDRPGAFIEPTFLKDIKPGNSAYTEEIFGPVFMLYVAKDEEEAIAIANASPFGLGGSVFSSDIERAKNVARQIDTGMVFINQITGSSPELPFGGTKKSGYGHELSPLGIHEFVSTKLIRVAQPTISK